MTGMSLPDALEHYKAARQHVHEAMDVRDPGRLVAALQVEAMWERIVDRKRLQAHMYAQVVTGECVHHQFQP